MIALKSFRQWVPKLWQSCYSRCLIVFWSLNIWQNPQESCSILIESIYLNQRIQCSKRIRIQTSEFPESFHCMSFPWAQTLGIWRMLSLWLELPRSRQEMLVWGELAHRALNGSLKLSKQTLKTGQASFTLTQKLSLGVSSGVSDPKQYITCPITVFFFFICLFFARNKNKI